MADLPVTFIEIIRCTVYLYLPEHNAQFFTTSPKDAYPAGTGDSFPGARD